MEAPAYGTLRPWTIRQVLLGSLTKHMIGVCCIHVYLHSNTTITLISPVNACCLGVWVIGEMIINCAVD